MTLPPHTPGPDGGSPADDDPGPVNQGVSPMGDAFAWASQIIAIGLAMFLPAVAGNWLDARLGTRFLGPAGLVFGLVSGLAWIVRLGNSVKPYKRRARSGRPAPGRGRGPIGGEGGRE